jgi:hypothetical protein
MDLQAFWQQEVSYVFNRLLEQLDLNLTEDRSEYVYVDGEEGDFGVIRYKDAAGEVVAVRTIEGGDSEYTELTEHGKPLVAAKMLEAFRQSLTEKLQLAPGAI